MARKPSPKPVSDELLLARVMTRLIIDGDRNGDALGRLVGAEAQGQRLHELARDATVIVNLVSKAGRYDFDAYYVRGSEATPPADERSRYVVSFFVDDFWTHVGFRLAYGDQASDLTFRTALLKAAPDGVERLSQWLTPAGQATTQRLRRGPKGDRHAHIELTALDRYHGTFEALAEGVEGLATSTRIHPFSRE